MERHLLLWTLQQFDDFDKRFHRQHFVQILHQLPVLSVPCSRAVDLPGASKLVRKMTPKSKRAASAPAAALQPPVATP